MSQLGFRAEQTDRAGDMGQIVWNCRLAKQSFGDAGAKNVGSLQDVVGRIHRAGPDEHRNFFPALITSAARRRSRSAGTIRGKE